MLAPLTPAKAQNVQELINRLERMERDMNILQRQVYRGGVPDSAATSAPTSVAPSSGAAPVAGDAYGALAVRMDKLESLVRELTGRVEESQFKNQQLEKRLTNLQEDLEFRLQRLEQGGAGTANNAASDQAGTPLIANNPPTSNQPGILSTMPANPNTSSGASSGTSSGAQSVALPNGTPEEQYNYAFSLLRNADYAAAEQAMSAFVVANPQHTLAGNAQYWLGETYYVRGDYEQAALTFAKGYKSYPESAKAADNLLKLGLSMANLGRNQEACAAFTQVPRQFPNAAGSVLRRASAEGRRMNCGA